MSEKKVLVIDDESCIRALVQDFLALEGIQCDDAETSKQGLELIAQNKYDVILLDRNLEHTKAEDIIEQIRKVENDIPIVILTGDADCNENYLEQVGAEGIIFKPFKVFEFIKKINTFLEPE
jgi:two-component system phosphate regulon response regulator PhoB